MSTTGENGSGAGGTGSDMDDLFLEPDAVPSESGASAELEALRREVATLRTEADSLRAERSELNDRYLRKAADLENQRRRHQREADDLRRYGGESVLKDIVTVLDDMDRAMEHLPADALEGPAAALVGGLQMVHRKFVQVLDRLGVKQFGAMGKGFDPNLHEAIQRLDDDSVPNDTVIREFQRGYTLHERLLRPALVVVAQGGPQRDVISSEDGEPEHSGSH
jgi:molecular chaperone GrpE